jgi:hypothetical protein
VGRRTVKVEHVRQNHGVGGAVRDVVGEADGVRDGVHVTNCDDVAGHASVERGLARAAAFLPSALQSTSELMSAGMAASQRLMTVEMFRHSSVLVLVYVLY